MKKINWNIFHNNSSSVDALVEFVCGYSIGKAVGLIWDPEARTILRSLKKLPVKNARRRARRWLNKNFMSWGPNV